MRRSKENKKIPTTREKEMEKRREIERLNMELGGGNIIETTVVNHKRRVDCYSDDEYELEMERYNRHIPNDMDAEWLMSDDE